MDVFFSIRVNGYVHAEGLHAPDTLDQVMDVVNPFAFKRGKVL
jgi:hypothetical protein